MKLSKYFKNATQDYFYLIEKNYPEKNILNLVGTRYNLSGLERSVLYRGVTNSTNCNLRRKKQLNNLPAYCDLIIIDSFNQIISIANYLSGNLVFISNDGCLRDASEMHGKTLSGDLLTRSVKLILKFLKSKAVKQSCFLVDKQMTQSPQVKKNLLDLSRKYEQPVQIRVLDNVDKVLKETGKGLIATSDSQVIDKSKVNFLDLAYKTLIYHFDLNIFNFNSFPNEKV